ncbi:MAG: HEPN domain-containing protein [Desulfobacterales bacterium]|nr:HEPN domain-containing protein [Desulfobacterales bacterium]
MRDELLESLSQKLSVYELPEDKAVHQPYVDRAEEDLLCAISLYRRGACGYAPLNNVCYLLHQAIEKWLKLLIEVRVGTSPQKNHDLFVLLSAIADLDPAFLSIRDEIEALEGN